MELVRLLGIYEKAINDKFSFEDKLKLVKEAGFDFMEFSIDESEERLARLDWDDDKIREIKQLCIKHDVVLNSMTLSANRRYPFGSMDPAVREAGIEIVHKAIILAKKLGIRNIQLAGYDEYYKNSNLNTQQYFLSTLGKIIEFARSQSVMLSIETMDREFMGSIRNVAQIVNYFNSPFLSIYPDLGNISQWGSKLDLYMDLKLNADKIVAFHFKDTINKRFRDIPFGKGEVDFVLLMTWILKLKIYAPIMIEMWSTNNPKETYDENLGELVSAREFYQNVLEEAEKKV